jgi:anti-sigma factor RsiW
MSHPRDAISEDDLHAYIDGRLEPVRRLAIAAYLATHPREAARTEALRAQAEGLRALFNHILDQPVPERLRESAHRRRPARRRLAWVVAAASLAFALAWGGWALQDRIAAAPLPAGNGLERPAGTEIAPDAPVFAPPARRRAAI